MSDGNTYVISGLRAKRSAMAGRVVDGGESRHGRGVRWVAKEQAPKTETVGVVSFIPSSSANPHKARLWPLAAYFPNKKAAQCAEEPMDTYYFTYFNESGVLIRQTAMQCGSDTKALDRARDTMKDKYAGLFVTEGDRSVYAFKPFLACR